MRRIAWVACGIVLAGMLLGAAPVVAQTTYAVQARSVVLLALAVAAGNRATAK